MTEAASDGVTKADTSHVEIGAKRVRCYLGGKVVADTVTPRLVWERPYCPTYFFPASDVRAELVPTADAARETDGAVVCDVQTAHAKAARAAVRFPDDDAGPLSGLVRFDWEAMDEWLEEDEPVYKHPRNPYTRVDILASSRHVQVAIDAVTIVDSVRPRILFETGLVPRYYLPLADVRTDLLRPTATRTWCPYKGEASYWTAVVDGSVHEDVAWMYRSPLPESAKIAGLVCFYDELVDVTVDGVPRRPLRPYPERPA